MTRAIMRDSFRHFRRTWSPRAAYHLARVRYGEEWAARLVSAVWLASNRIPHSGVPRSRP